MADALYIDQVLVERLSVGDRLAYETIYRSHVHGLYEAAFKRLGDRAVSEDLVHDVFLRLWHKREQLQITNLSAYLYTAVRYEVLNYVTRHKEPLSFYTHFESLFLETDTPEQRLVTRELLDLVYKYAETLPAKRKQIFLLHIKNRLTTRQIADELGISQKTVQNQLGTALNDLRPHIMPILMLLMTSFFREN